MAKYVNQVRYYGEKSNKNHPETLTYRDMRYGDAFKYRVGEGAGIIQLGIQTLPGVKFWINEGTAPLIIGSTGIYELNVEGLTTIHNLKFDDTSLKTIDANDSAYIIVDYIYEREV